MGHKTSKNNKTCLPSHTVRSEEKQATLSIYTLSIFHRSVAKHKTQHVQYHNIENFVVIWLDSTISELNGDIQYTITQLRNIANFVETFSDLEKCMDFMKTIEDERIFLIVSGKLGRLLLPLTANMTQIDSIYIFCNHISQQKLWADQYRKIKGVCTKIEEICDRLKQDIRQSETDLTEISIMSNVSTIDTSELDQSFLFARLFKEVLLELKYNDNEHKEFLEFCRQQYVNSNRELMMIDEFEENYDQSSSVSWYIRESFIYFMLNKALRTHDIDVIMKMGYFIRNLHDQIEKLHSQLEHLHPFVVYRGQGVSHDEFENLKSSKGSFLLFNNFLLTNIMEDVSLTNACRARENPDSIGILFRMKIDPSISSTPFVPVDDIGWDSNKKKKILFSLNTVFCIGDMEEINERLWRVDLILITEDDRDLEHLTRSIRKEIEDKTGIDRIPEDITELNLLDEPEKNDSLPSKKIYLGNQRQPTIYHYHLGHINSDEDD